MILEIFFVLARFGLCEYVEITKKNVRSIIGGKQDSFVKFYSPTCGHCRAMAPDFAEAATAFSDVVFGGVDCSENKRICNKHKVDGYPTILLFKAGSSKGIEFKGERSFDGFCDFVENYTTHKAKRPPKVLLDMNPLSFKNITDSHKCTFVTFFAPWCGHCKRFLPEAKRAAQAFQGDSEIAIGRINCETYGDFCNENGATGYPTIKLFHGDEVDEYKDKRTAESVAEFINSHCGTERAADGLLTDTAGVIMDARPFVKEFIEGDKEDAYNKIKAINGADFYVKVMDRIKATGIEKAKEDMEKMKKLLDERKGSPKALDGMKRRYNVFNEFVNPPTPTPEPTPESTSEEGSEPEKETESSKEL